MIIGYKFKLHGEKTAEVSIDHIHVGQFARTQGGKVGTNKQIAIIGVS